MSTKGGRHDGFFKISARGDSGSRPDLTCRLLRAAPLSFGEDMKKKGSGYILNMSSMSAWMTMPGINVYNASKAFILNFSRSLWYELHPHNVGVTAICPGAVDTGLYGLSDYWRKIAVGLGISMRPEKLAQKALKKMYKKKKQYIPGWINHLFIPLIKHLPDWFIFLVIKKISCFQK